MTQKCSQTAPVNPLSPANGIVGALAPRRLVDDAIEGKLVDGAHGRPDTKPVAHLRDHEHRLLGHFVGHPRGQAASLFGSLAPKSGVVNEHGTHSSRAIHPTQEAPCGSYSNKKLADAALKCSGAAFRMSCADGVVAWLACPSQHLHSPACV